MVPSSLVKAAKAPRLSRSLPDLLGVSWVLIAGFAFLSPALLHGVYLGAFDALNNQGLSIHSTRLPHNSIDGDQIFAIIPWTQVAWTQVHHGQLPLWNPYNATGSPLAFNWQSAPLSLPSLLGYLVPVQFAYTVGIIATVVIAGTGGYVLGRVLRLGVLASATVGTVFELSGPMAAWLGWPHAEVMSWAGWLFVAAVLVLRGGNRARNVAFLAVIVALAIYAGQPEIATLLVVSLWAFIVTVVVVQTRQRKPLKRSVPPIIDAVIGTAAGGALAAPLALPGFQLASHSADGLSSLNMALPFHDLIHLVSQGFNGIPTPGALPFGETQFYTQTAAYVGPIVIVLAAVAVVIRARNPYVVGFLTIAVLAAAVVFVPAVVSVAHGLPVIGKVLWQRALLPLAFSLAVLAGFGMDLVVRNPLGRTVRRGLGIGFGVAGILVLAVYLGGRGHLPAAEAAVRARSFIWPGIEIFVGLTTVVTFAWAFRGSSPDASKGSVTSPTLGGTAPLRGASTLQQEPKVTFDSRQKEVSFGLPVGVLAGLILLACETAFLLVAGAELLPSSPRPLAPTASESTLQRAVGDSVVGFGAGSCNAQGIPVDANAIFGIHEFSDYDPALPTAYWQSWVSASGQRSFDEVFNDFCPRVTTAALARRYGVAFVLEPRGASGPIGGVFDVKVGNEDLYRIPDASLATITQLPKSGSIPAPDALGTSVPVNQSDPSDWKIRFSAATPVILRLRLTDVAGWHTSIDGRPLPLERFAGVMIEAHVPPGKHLVELSYWPSSFTLGIVLAFCTAAGLFVAVLLSGIRRRQR